MDQFDLCLKGYYIGYLLCSKWGSRSG